MIEAGHLAHPTMSELAGALASDAARASRVVTDLQRAGLVQRIVGASDRRRREVTLTELGQQLLDEARGVRIGFIAAAIRDWEQEDVAELARLLSRFNESVRQLAPYWTSTRDRSTWGAT